MTDFQELTVNEAAKYAGVERLQIHWWMKRQMLPIYRITPNGKTVKSTDVDRCVEGVS